MKQTLSAAAALLCAVALLPFAHAQTTTVTATQLRIGGTAIGTGNVSMLAVDSRGAALSVFTSDGSLNGPAPFKGTVNAGAIAGGFTVPDQCTSTASTANTPIWYRAEVSSTTAPNQSIVVMIPPGTVCGSNFALDHYSPLQTVTPIPAGLISPSSVTIGATCTSPLLGYLSVAPFSQIQCEAGHIALAPSSGGATIALTTNGSSGAATLTNGTLNIPNYATGGSTAATVTALTCNGTLAIPFPSAGAKTFYQVTTTANCTVSFTNAPSSGTGAETRVLFNPTTYTVAFPAGSSSLIYTGGTAPAAPTSTAYSTFHATAFGSLVVVND